MATPISIVAYLALFAVAGALFLFFNLLIGYFVRPKLPNQEKQEVYECGEPVIGTSFVQFDLRFYVVALLFIIFDVEIAFFFPWATVFGKATQLSASQVPVLAAELDPSAPADQLSSIAEARFRELGVPESQLAAGFAAPDVAAPGGLVADSVELNSAAIRETAATLSIASLADIGVFFGVLMVGFAYVWKRGDLDWVRAVPQDYRERAPQPAVPARVVEQETSSILSA